MHNQSQNQNQSPSSIEDSLGTRMLTPEEINRAVVEAERMRARLMRQLVRDGRDHVVGLFRGGRRASHA